MQPVGALVLKFMTKRQPFDSYCGISMPHTASFCCGVKVGVGDGVFVAVGQGTNTLGYSTNGSSWTAVTGIFGTSS